MSMPLEFTQTETGEDADKDNNTEIKKHKAR